MRYYFKIQPSSRRKPVPMLCNCNTQKAELSGNLCANISLVIQLLDRMGPGLRRDDDTLFYVRLQC
jgi:hypothetical protein